MGIFNLTLSSIFFFALTFSLGNPAVWVPRNFPPMVKNPGNKESEPHRMKRSPFIMAFQVTRPPGMFQMSLRRPYIFNMMSNFTRTIMASNLTQMIRRGFGALPFGIHSEDNATIIDDAVRSRQEDLELLYR